MPKETPDPDFMRGIGIRLQAIQDAVGVNQATFIKGLGVEQNTWSQWVTGKNMPNIPTLIRMCDRYQVTLDWVYRGTPSGIPDPFRADVIKAHAALLDKPVAKRSRTRPPAPRRRTA